MSLSKYVITTSCVIMKLRLAVYFVIAASCVINYAIMADYAILKLRLAV